MAKFQITFCEDKNPDWKIISVFGDNATTVDVSVNRVNKKGETFPDFDIIKEGAEIDGQLWKSDAGKNYLFAPRPENAKAPMRSPAAITKAMDKKAENIEKAQDNKSLGIKVSATMGHAVNITIALLKGQTVLDEGVTKKMITDWRKWLWENWDKEDSDFDPFPSN